VARYAVRRTLAGKRSERRYRLRANPVRGLPGVSGCCRKSSCRKTTRCRLPNTGRVPSTSSFIARYFREIPEAEVLPGDLVVYKLGLAYAHAAAVVVQWPEYVIQAEMRHGVSGAHGDEAPGVP
jgi:hypothetical protein